jgi:hypothetical protein
MFLFQARISCVLRFISICDLTLPRIHMFSSVAPALLGGFYLYLIFMSLSIRGRCPGNMKIPATKIGALKMGPKICHFSSKWLQKFSLNFSNAWRPSL